MQTLEINSQDGPLDGAATQRMLLSSAAGDGFGYFWSTLTSGFEFQDGVFCYRAMAWDRQSNGSTDRRTDRSVD